MTTLYIFSGLPGSGKTTLAKHVAGELNLSYLRIDTIEQALRDLCDVEVIGEGYRLAYRLAADSLQLGHSVVADSCNPIKLTRDEWVEVAVSNQARYVNIEVICSDVGEHRMRVEQRQSDIPNLKQPTWEQVIHREYDDWHMDRIVLDTAGEAPGTSVRKLIAMLEPLV